MAVSNYDFLSTAVSRPEMQASRLKYIDTLAMLESSVSSRAFPKFPAKTTLLQDLIFKFIGSATYESSQFRFCTSKSGSNKLYDGMYSFHCCKDRLVLYACD